MIFYLNCKLVLNDTNSLDYSVKKKVVVTYQLQYLKI